MQLTPLIQHAIEQATILHHGQIRKGDDLPYIIHPYEVAWLLANYTDNEHIIAAGLLHDVLEDVKDYTTEDMTRDFGKEVTNIVQQVSEDKDPSIAEDEKETWQTRKEKYLANLAHDSYGALMVCAADKIHNLNSMLDAYKKHGDKLWEKFNASPEKKMWFYEEVLKVLQAKLDNPIVQQLATTYNIACKTFKF